MTVYQDAPHEPLDELGLLLARYAGFRAQAGSVRDDRVRAELRARAQRAAVRRRAEALALAAAPAAVVTVPSRRDLRWLVDAPGVLRDGRVARPGSDDRRHDLRGLACGRRAVCGPGWVDTATLSRDPEARLEGEIAFAGTRLAEAAEATVKGDAPAATAALDAFGAIVQLAIDENPSIRRVTSGRSSRSTTTRTCSHRC